MKKITAITGFLFTLGLALAGAETPPADAAKPSAEAAANTHSMTVEVVSVDTAARSITARNEKGETQTFRAAGKAAKKLQYLKAGDRVTLVCQDDEKGEHRIVGLKLVKPHTEAGAKPGAGTSPEAKPESEPKPKA